MRIQKIFPPNKHQKEHSVIMYTWGDQKKGLKWVIKLNFYGSKFQFLWGNSRIVLQLIEDKRAIYTTSIYTKTQLCKNTSSIENPTTAY